MCRATSRPFLPRSSPRPAFNVGNKVIAVAVRPLGGGPGNRVMTERWCAKQDSPGSVWFQDSGMACRRT